MVESDIIVIIINNDNSNNIALLSKLRILNGSFGYYLYCDYVCENWCLPSFVGVALVTEGEGGPPTQPGSSALRGNLEQETGHLIPNSRIRGTHRFLTRLQSSLQGML